MLHTSRASAPPLPWFTVLCLRGQLSLDGGERAGRWGQLRVAGELNVAAPGDHDQQGRHPLDRGERAEQSLQLHFFCPTGEERAGQREQLHVVREHTPVRATAPTSSLTPKKPVSPLGSPPTAPDFSLAQRVPVPSPEPRATFHFPVAAAGDGSCSVPTRRRGTAAITRVHSRPRRSAHLRAIVAFTISFVDILLLLFMLAGVDNCFFVGGVHFI